MSDPEFEHEFSDSIGCHGMIPTLYKASYAGQLMKAIPMRIERAVLPGMVATTICSYWDLNYLKLN